MNGALAVAGDHIADAGAEQDLGGCNAGRARSQDDAAQVRQLFAHDPRRVLERCQRDHRGAVLIVVEHGDVERGAQRLFDLERPGRRDVLQVDAAEGGRQPDDCLHDLVRLVDIKADRERIHTGEFLEQQRLALHHRHRSRRADVTETQHCRTVADDRDCVALDRQVVDPLGLIGDRSADTSHAGRIGHGEVIGIAQRDASDRLQLAAGVQFKGAIKRSDDRDAFEPVDRVADLDDVLLAGRVHHDVLAQRALGDREAVEALDVAAYIADRGAQPAERAGLVGQLYFERGGIGGGGSRSRGGSHRCSWRALGAVRTMGRQGIGLDPLNWV